MGILEKISDIEREIARTQKNKGKTCTNYGKFKLKLLVLATEGHLGILKAKLAKYRQDLIDIKTAASGGGKVIERYFMLKMILLICLG